VVFGRDQVVQETQAPHLSNQILDDGGQGHGIDDQAHAGDDLLHDRARFLLQQTPVALGRQRQLVQLGARLLHERLLLFWGHALSNVCPGHDDLATS